DGLLADGLPYEAIAGPLGLEVQPGIGKALAEIAAESGGDPTPPPEIVRADLDTSDFSPGTIEFLRASAQLMSSPDLATWLARARELGRRFDGDATEGVLTDILARRNEALLAALDAALAGHDDIVVPWGALHLPEVERALLARGFSLERDEHRQ